jgi:hypothetical protein
MVTHRVGEPCCVASSRKKSCFQQNSRCGLHPASAKLSHTTHVLSTATIHCLHHPYFGVTVMMGRKCSHFGPHRVQVALPSGAQMLIPEWMFDEDSCRGMGIVEHSTLSITALLSLRDLVDAQPRTPEPSGTTASEASSPGGAYDEPTPPGSTCPPIDQRLWITMQQVAAMLGVSEMVVRRLIAQNPLPAKQIVKFAPWMMERAAWSFPRCANQIRRVYVGLRTGRM